MVMAIKGTMRPLFLSFFFFPLHYPPAPNKVAQRLSVLSLHPLPSPPSTKQQGEGHFLLTVRGKNLLVILKAKCSRATVLVSHLFSQDIIWPFQIQIFMVYSSPDIKLLELWTSFAPPTMSAM